MPTFDEALELVGREAQVSPSIALDVKEVSPGFFGKICAALEKHGLVEAVIGIGAIISSADVRRQFRRAAAQFPCAALAQTPADRDVALKDQYAEWVYVRYVPTAEDIEAVKKAGKRLFASGPAVSLELDGALAAYRAGADMVLTFHPSKLAALIGTGHSPA